MQNKSTGKTVLIVLLLLITIASLILATFAWARYTTIETGSASATVAKWDVAFNNTSSRITKTYSHVVDGKLAPGTDGSITMAIASPDTETAYEFTIDITKLANKPTNLHFYTDEAFTNEINLDTGLAFKGFVPLSGDPQKADFANVKMYTGVLTSGQPVIYWQWKYQTEDTSVLNFGTNSSVIPTAAQDRVKHDLTVVAKEKGATVEESDTIATLIEKLQALQTADTSTRVISDVQIATVINDAIDTSEALDPKEMSFDVEFEAVQYQPGTDAPDYANN